MKTRMLVFAAFVAIILALHSAAQQRIQVQDAKVHQQITADRIKAACAKVRANYPPCSGKNCSSERGILLAALPAIAKFAALVETITRDIPWNSYGESARDFVETVEQLP